LQNPNQFLLTQWPGGESGFDGGVGVGIADHALQNPNQFLLTQCDSSLGGESGFDDVGVGIAGGEVMLCDCVVVVTSLHPQRYPGVLQSVVLEGAETDVEVASLQPNQPGVLHEDVDVFVEVGVEVLVLVLLLVVDVSSLQPNHPGVLQVEVVVVVVVVLVEVTGPVVVVSSKQPHQPGV